MWCCVFFTNMCFFKYLTRNHKILTFPKRCAAKFHAERALRCSEISHMELICAKTHFLEMHPFYGNAPGVARHDDDTEFSEPPRPLSQRTQGWNNPCGETPHSDMFFVKNFWLRRLWPTSSPGPSLQYIAHPPWTHFLPEKGIRWRTVLHRCRSVTPNLTFC